MTKIKDGLIKTLNDKSSTVCVIGLGYVGLPLLTRFTEIGYKVIGIDIDQRKVEALREGKSYLKHIPDGIIKKSIKKGLHTTTDMAEVADADAIILCVPTPLNKYREPDLSFIISTIESIVPYLNQGQVISLESTTYPGTTEEELYPRIKNAGFSVGKDIFLVYSPEREDPGNSKYSTSDIPKICSGYSKQCLEVGIALYQHAVSKVVPVSSLKAAEMTKLLENIHRAVNIGLVNELKIVADKMGIDIYEVIKAAATKPFGFTPYYPGPGLGGHCIPIDPFYLTWKAKEFGINTSFIELAGEVNSKMPEWVIEKAADALNRKCKPLKGSSILILGIAYKKNVDDSRESPAARIIKLLSEKEADVQYSDPHIPEFPKMRDYSFPLKSIDLTKDTIGSFDCVIVVTDHDDFDFEYIGKHASLVVDTRGVYQQPMANVISA